MFCSYRDAPAKGITGIENKGRLRRDKRLAGDGWQEVSISQNDAPFEDAPDHTFLTPDLARSQETFGKQAGQLGAGAGAAGGPVVLLAWAEHEIPAIHGWG